LKKYTLLVFHLKSIGQFLSSSDEARDKFPEEGIPYLIQQPMNRLGGSMASQLLLLIKG
jgi:hypothetical protein